MTLKIAEKVVPFNGSTRLNLPAERVLKAALDAELEDVVIMGKHPDGQYYFASPVADGGTVLWMWEKLKQRMMEV